MIKHAQPSTRGEVKDFNEKEFEEAYNRILQEEQEKFMSKLPENWDQPFDISPKKVRLK